MAKLKKQSKIQQNVLKPRKIRIRVVGLGGGGTSIVSEMAQSLSGVNFVVADTDSRVFKKVKNKRGIRVFQFGAQLIGGMGTGMNVEIAQKAAIESKEKIAKLFENQDLSILIGSLGGGVASGAGPVFALESRNQKNISLGIFTLPFQFEGEKKMKIAKKALAKVRENLSGVIVVPNEQIFQIVDKKTPLKKSLSSLNQMFADWLVDLIEVISKPSLINIDFADLKTILRGRGETVFFGQAIAQGPARTEEAIKKLFQNPLLNEKPSSVRSILFNITGGKDLSIREVQSISQSIGSLNNKAKIIFGISQLPKYTGKIKITLVALSDEQMTSSKQKKVSLPFSKKNQTIKNRKPRLDKKNNHKVKNNNSKEKNNANSKQANHKESRENNKAEHQEKTRRTALEIKTTAES